MAIRVARKLFATGFNTTALRGSFTGFATMRPAATVRQTAMMQTTRTFCSDVSPNPRIYELMRLRVEVHASNEIVQCVNTCCTIINQHDKLVAQEMIQASVLQDVEKYAEQCKKLFTLYQEMDLNEREIYMQPHAKHGYKN